MLNKFLFNSSIFIFAFSFSWLCPLLFSKFLGNNWVELPLILGIYFLNKSNHPAKYILYKTITSSKFNFILLLVLIGAVIGYLNNSNNILNVYGDFRANIIFIIIFLFFYSSLWESIKDEKEEFLTKILVILSFFELITIVSRPYLNFFSENSKEVVSIIAPSLCSIIFVLRNKYLKSIFFLSIVVYIAIFGFFRNYYLVALITGFIVLLTIMKQVFYLGGLFQKMFLIGLLSSICILSIYFFPKVINYWNSDEGKMIHSINRTKELFSDTKDSESERINSVIVVFENANDLLIPHGIGWRNFINKISTDYKIYTIVSTMDSCLFYLAYHYGFILAITVLIMICFASLSALIKTSKNSTKLLLGKFIQVIFILLFFASFFSQGLMLTTIPGAFIYGALLSIILKPF